MGMSQEANMALFDIIGPVMVGPSSSHTAGAVRLGLMSRILLKEEPVNGEIMLHGSFATTGKGHGTQQGDNGITCQFQAASIPDYR